MKLKSVTNISHFCFLFYIIFLLDALCFKTKRNETLVNPQKGHLEENVAIASLSNRANLNNNFSSEINNVITNNERNFISVKLTKQSILPHKLYTYYGKISIGEYDVNEKIKTNVFNVLFDTGSSEFWVPYETCKDPSCLNHNKYVKSKTFRHKYNKTGMPSTLEIDYLSGKLTGFDGYDSVFIGDDLIVPNTNIAFATSVNIPLLEEFHWDGILGLGFGNDDSKSRGIKTFLDTLVDSNVMTERNLKNQFGYYLSETGGTVTFGGIDNNLKRSPEEDFVWAPITTEMGFWTIDLLGIRKEKAIPVEEMHNKKNDIIVKIEGFHDGGKKSVVDTGTFLIYAPKKTMENYLSDIKISSCEDKKNLPYLIFQIRAKEMKNIQSVAVIELVLSPDDYVIEFVDEKNSTRECMLGIEADEQSEEDQIDGWTLGQVFLKSFYTIFDKDNLQIGFVKSKKSVRKQTAMNASFTNLRTNTISKNYNGPL